jgi:hypothetical protein
MQELGFGVTFFQVRNLSYSLARNDGTTDRLNPEKAGEKMVQTVSRKI